MKDYSFLYSKNKLSSALIRRAKEEGKLQDLIEDTSYLPLDSSITLRLYHYENNLKYIPKCKVCNSDLKFINDKFKGYKDTCSAKCSGLYRRLSNSEDIPEEAKKFRLTQYQLDFFKSNPNIEWPLCKCGCGQKVLLNTTNSKKVFRLYASSSCSRKDKTVSKDIEALLSNENWLRDQREVKKKSIDLIAEELGISTSPVKKWCVYFNIDIRLNESNSKTKSLLEDRDWLYEQHVINKKTCQTIASEIGSSAPTVSVYLEKHKIEANNPNEYPRKFIRTSKACSEIVSFIKSFYDGEVVENNRSILEGRELDIYLPDKKFAIEYNGVYHHLYRPYADTLPLRKDIEYHKSKTIICRNKNIRLFQIWSSQWIEKEEIIKSMIKNMLGYSDKKIYARQCSIEHITPYEKDSFLDNNHLQGKDKSLLKYGLYHEEKLVAVMTFCKSRFNKSYDWELSRYSCLRNNSVIGGFSKLLKHFERNNEGSIISYANLMHSYGDVYSRNGFRLIHENVASYWYVKRGTETLEHRSKFRKKFITFEEDDRTEEEIMDFLGYDKIFDCGTLVFVKTKEGA